MQLGTLAGFEKRGVVIVGKDLHEPVPDAGSISIAKGRKVKVTSCLVFLGIAPFLIFHLGVRSQLQSANNARTDEEFVVLGIVDGIKSKLVPSVDL